MREGIHPDYYQATVTCNCGNTFVTGSTKPEIHVEICSKCHPFYTGQQKANQARGRIEQFNIFEKVEAVQLQPFFFLLEEQWRLNYEIFRSWRTGRDGRRNDEEQG